MTEGDSEATKFVAARRTAFPEPARGAAFTILEDVTVPRGALAGMVRFVATCVLKFNLLWGYLSNLELVQRFANRWELNPPADVNLWSAPDALRYTEFPFHPYP